MFGTFLLAASVLVECEGFSDLGGWLRDPSSMRQMGSTYVIAHGYGVPVRDAVTTVDFAEAGRYFAWARTRNWAAEWSKGAPGRFQVAVGDAVSSALGTEGRAWHWQKAGAFDLAAGRQTVRLHDLTGFNGRCDALYFTTDEGDVPPDDAAKLEAWRPAKSGIAVRDAAHEYDLVVVGGGVAGSCMALSAARYGVDVLVLQDRDVVGGCNSSEVRVSMGGRIHTGPYPELGNVVAEIQPLVSPGHPREAEYYEDARKKTAFDAKGLVGWATPGVKPALELRQHVYAVETVSNRIVAVVARNVATGEETRYRARLFCDATGDATLARLAGCETMYGREPRARFNEISAPEKGDRMVMGHTTQWLSELKGAPAPFPDISDWALPVDDASGVYQERGSWEQETGYYRDMADDTEAIRDYGLLAIFSNWNWIKNRSPKRADYANRAISWMSPIGGKRESYRVVGDHILTQNDLENQVSYPDATAAATWNIDLHFPDPENAKHFAEPFRAVAYHRGFGPDYPVPYRCLYARDCANLFLAGRDISVSHCAFAAVRVMRTLGMLGEVTGLAAVICTREKCLPRDVYEKHLDALKAMMAAGVRKLPTYHGYQSGWSEGYDLNDRGWVHLYPYGRPGSVPKARLEEVKTFGYVHRNEHPDLQNGRRRFVLADESRNLLHYYDSCDYTNCYSVAVGNPVWDLKRVGDMRYRVVIRGGFQIVDMKARKVVETFTYPAFRGFMASAVCDLPDGGFVISMNPENGPDANRNILLYDFSPVRRLRRVVRIRGIFNARSMCWNGDGVLLVCHEKGFARVRLPAGGEEATVERDFAIPDGRNLFSVKPSLNGDGYWAGTGYGKELVHYSPDGEAVSRWCADQGGKANFFYGQPFELANGHVYVCNWTGHGANDSFKGCQVIEFDRDGKVVWTLDSPERFGSISGIDVLQAPGKW